MKATRCIEVKLDPKSKSTCVTSTGEYDISEVLLEVCDEEAVEIGFVSRHLHRRVHAGGVIPLRAMDKLAAEWIRMRKLAPGTTAADLGELKVLAKNLRDVAHDMDKIAEELR